MLALATGSAPADHVAQRIRAAEADYALLAAPADSAWFAEVARQAGLELSGPGRAGPSALAFLGRKPLGDTTVALPVAGGPALVVHDALYAVDRGRYLDLLALRLEPGTPVRAAVRAFLDYVATDVMANAAVAVAIEAPSPAVGDSLAAVLDPVFTDARLCAGREPGPPLRMRLFYGPEARIACAGARTLPGEPPAVLARLVVQR